MNQIQGFIELCNLPENDKIAILNEFGRLAEFYIAVCNFSNQRINNVITEDELRDNLDQIEIRLDALNLSIESDEITSNISNDFNEIITFQEIPILETPCKEEFQLIRNWFIESILI